MNNNKNRKISFKMIKHESKRIYYKCKKFIINYKWIFGGILLALIAVIGFLVVYNQLVLKDKNADNSNNVTVSGRPTTKLESEEIYNKLEFSNINLSNKEKNYNLTMSVTNPTKKIIDIEQVLIDIYDKDNNRIITLIGYIGGKIKPKEIRTITTGTQVNLEKAVSKVIYTKDDIKSTKDTKSSKSDNKTPKNIKSIKSDI